jgi:hypothetical protein
VQLVVLMIVAHICGVDALDSHIGTVVVLSDHLKRFDGDVLQTLQRETGVPKALAIGTRVSANGS